MWSENSYLCTVEYFNTSVASDKRLHVKYTDGVVHSISKKVVTIRTEPYSGHCVSMSFKSVFYALLSYTPHLVTVQARDSYF